MHCRPPATGSARCEPRDRLPESLGTLVLQLACEPRMISKAEGYLKSGVKTSLSERQCGGDRRGRPGGESTGILDARVLGQDSSRSRGRHVGRHRTWWLRTAPGWGGLRRADGARFSAGHATRAGPARAPWEVKTGEEGAHFLWGAGGWCQRPPPPAV